MLIRVCVGVCELSLCVPVCVCLMYGFLFSFPLRIVCELKEVSG